MQLPSLIRVGRKQAQRLELQAERIVTAVVTTAFVVAIGYSILWWIAVFLTAAIGEYMAAACFIVLGLISVSIITPVGTIIGLFDIIENFLPFNKEDIPTKELTAMVGGPLALSLVPFAFAFLVGVESSSEFIKIAFVFYLLCLAGGFVSTPQKKK